jgi:ribosomal protein S18 acetylase RimI-like enzyme
VQAIYNVPGGNYKSQLRAPRGSPNDGRPDNPVIEYRCFRNTDPPGLVEAWNEALTGRGAVRLRNSSPLERHAFSKVFFDPSGLILAREQNRCLGFVHAGFGARADGGALDPETGVTCLLAVRPSHRGKGIGTELLRRSEAYLRGRGARRLFAGQAPLLNPFYFGLYGGSNLPGFLASDTAAEPFFTKRGYKVCRSVRVFHRRLSLPVKVFDPRFAAHRQRFELLEDVVSRLGTWWQYNLFNGSEPRVFSLLDKTTNAWAAQATLCEMEGFGERWNQGAVGVLHWLVNPTLQRQGLGRFLLANVLRKAQEDMFNVVEIQVPDEIDAAWRLCMSLGFELVDVGKVYERVEQ